MINSEITPELHSFRNVKNKPSLLLQGNACQASGILFTGLIHEYNNLNSSIVGYAELLQASDNLSTKEAFFLENIQLMARRSTQLSQVWLDIVKSVSIDSENVDLNHIILEASKVIATDDKTAAIAIEDSGSLLPSIYGNATLLRQLLDNLLRNAASSLVTNNTPAPKILIHAEADEKWVYISIRDNGPGFSSQCRAQLFAPFFSTKNNKQRDGSVTHEGYGVGLAFCKWICIAHGGNIEAHSILGDGACFTACISREKGACL